MTSINCNSKENVRKVFNGTSEGGGLFRCGLGSKHKLFNMMQSKLYSRGFLIIKIPDILKNRDKPFEIQYGLDQIDFQRTCQLSFIVDYLKENQIDGEIAELGVYQGDFARLMNYLLPNKKLYLFDTFEGFENDFKDTSIKFVKDKLFYPDQAIFLKGKFPQTTNGIEVNFSLVSLDADHYQSTLDGLRFFYPRMVKGGIILVHDFNTKRYGDQVKKAVKQYAREKNISYVPSIDVSGSVIIIKN